MIIKLNRLMTAEQVKTLYQIPDGLFEKIRPDLPVADICQGTNYYLETHLDPFLHRWFQSPGFSHSSGQTGNHAQPGKLPTGDRMIHPDEVQLDGEIYGPLTPQQWRLMEIVLEKTVVTTNEAVRHVYGGRFAGKEEALRQHKKRINNLLLDEGCQKQIDFSNGYFVLR